MRTFCILFFAFLAAAALPASAADDSDKKAFQEAYAAYQQAIADEKPFRAIAPAREAYEIGKKLFGPEHKNTANLALNYGRLLQNEEATEVLYDALRIFEAIYGSDAIELVDPLMDLAATKAKYGTLGPAKGYYSRALDITEKHQSEDSLLAGLILLEIGRIALSESQSRSAMKYFRKAEKVFMAQPKGIAEVQLAQTRFWMGKYELATSDYDDATDYLLASLEIFEKVAPQSSMTLTNHAFLVSAYESRNMRDEATRHCVAIGKAKPVDPDQDYRPVYQIRPIYPMGARQMGSEGYVIISTTVDKNGFVKQPRVIEREGSKSFEAAALQAVEKFRYVPRFENGEAVETHDVKYRFSFALAD